MQSIVMKSLTLVEELSRENYQSDQRVAETMLSSQKRKGKGPNQIKMKLKSKKIDTALDFRRTQRNRLGSTSL